MSYESVSQLCRRMSRPLVWGAVLAAFLPAAQAAGSAGTWLPLAPGGSRVQALAAAAGSPAVYAGTAYGGVFRTVDRGATWQAANLGLQGFDVAALAVAPGGAPLYAATESGLFRSDDGAATWRATAFPDGATAVALGTAGSSGAVATLYAADLTGVYRSDDGGGTWNGVLTFPVPDVLPLAALAIDAGSPQHVYFGLADEGTIWISRTGGATWRQVSLGGAGVSRVVGLTADPAHPGTAYAATDAALFVSRNGGGTWAPVPGLPPGSYTAAGFAADAPGTLWAATDKARGRLWKSTDDGATWTFAYAGDPLTAIAGDPLRPQRAYAAATPEGVLHGTFAPGAAAPQLGAIAASSVAALAIDAQIAGAIYAYGLLAPPPPSSGVGPANLPTGSLRLSSDGGATWHPAIGLPPQGLLNVFAAPASTVRSGKGGAYALPMPQFFTVPYPYGTSQLLYSNDAGATWQTLSTLLGPTWDVAVAPSAPLVLYAAGYENQPDIRPCPYSCAPFVAASSDGGVTWTYNYNLPPINLPFGTAGPPGWLVRIAPNDPQTAYIGEAGTLIKTTDGGQTWTLLAGLIDQHTGFEALLDLAIDPQQPTRLYAVRQDGTASASTDGGQTWQPLGTGLPTGAVRRIVTGPAALAAPAGSGAAAAATPPPPLYAATAQGVYASFDRGATWAPLGTGLPTPSVLTLAVDPVRGTVYAGVEGAGGLFVLSQ